MRPFSFRRRWLLRLPLCLLIILVGTVSGLWVQSTRLGTWVELRTYDLRFKLRGPLPILSQDQIVILAVDEQSFSEIPDPFLLWQVHFAKVLDALVAAGAGAIGMDFIFSDISGIDPEGQQAFLQSLLRARAGGVPLILAYRVRSGSVDQPSPLIAMAAGEDGFAYVNLTSDSDNFVRKQELFSTNANGEQAPGFAFSIARAFLQRQSRELAPLPDSAPTILINYRDVSPFVQVPFWQALEAAGTGNTEFFEERFREKVVLIGTIGDEDLHSTPLYYWGSRTEKRQSLRTPGVEIHAHVIAALLDGDFIRPLSPSSQSAITALLVAAVTLSCFFFAPLTALTFSALLLIAYLYIACDWAFRQGWLMFLVSPVVGTLLVGGVTETLNYIQEGRQRRRLRQLFQRYVSEDVIEQILETPENLRLQGERKTISVLFSDIRNFTTRSEGVAAETLVSNLNRYFTEMVKAVQIHNGLVDKFLGDGLMAIFGAPLDDPHSAHCAVKAAQCMLQALVSLNRELEAVGVEPIQIGIGIHSGEAVVGNIGSPQRMEYTAIGDVVNIASRIEGLTKKYGPQILISGETFRALNGTVQAEYVGQELLKGKTQSTEIYAVLV